MEITNNYKLDSKYFGEGSDMVVVNGEKRIYMLTWLERDVLIFDENLNFKDTIKLPTQIKEGWGLSHYIKDDKYYLLATDGSSKIYHIDPENFTVIKSVDVVDKNGVNVKYLNEIEMYNGKILANVFMTNKILLVDPESGAVLSEYNFS